MWRGSFAASVPADSTRVRSGVDSEIGRYVESCRGIAGGSGKSASAPFRPLIMKPANGYRCSFAGSTLCGWRNHPDLLHKRQVVFQMPVFSNAALLYSVDVGCYEVYSLPFSMGAVEGAGEVPCEPQM